MRVGQNTGVRRAPPKNARWHPSAHANLRRTMRLARPLTLMLLVAALDLGVACTPKPGDSCRQNYDSCSTPTSRLACNVSTYAMETCKGPKGCSSDGKLVTCDATRGDIGDPCVATNTQVCATDGKSKLRCEGGRYVLVSHCGGSDGCTSNDKGEPYCSRAFLGEGEPCKEGTGACAQDEKAELACKGGKMVFQHVCRGQDGCTAHSMGPICDRSTALIGEPCEGKDPETSFTCAPDKLTVYLCKDGKFVQGPRCGGAFKCGVATYGIDGRRHFRAECDQSAAIEGEACVTDLKAACSEDETARLMCQNGKFVLDKKCKYGCEIASVPAPFMCKEPTPPPNAPKGRPTR